MNYILAVFKSRYATLNFASILRANNIPVAIINTPQTIGRVCGISVKFLSDYFSKVQSILANSLTTNFEGFYSCVERNGRINLFKL